MKLICKVEVTNEKQAISKDHGNSIPAGTELEFKTIPPKVKRLIDMGAIMEMKDAGAPSDDE